MGQGFSVLDVVPCAQNLGREDIDFQWYSQDWELSGGRIAFRFQTTSKTWMWRRRPRADEGPIGAMEIQKFHEQTAHTLFPSPVSRIAKGICHIDG